MEGGIFKLKSIRHQLVVMVLAVVVPALVLAGAVAYQQREAVIAEAYDRSERLARLATADFSQFVEGTRMVLAAFAHLPEVYEKNWDACNALFAEMLPNYPRVLNFGVVDTDGVIRCSAVPSDPIDANDRLWFRRAIETDAFANGEYQIGRITGSPSLNFSYPVHGEDGAVIAVVYAAIDLVWVDDQAAEVGLAQDSVFVLFDHEGTVLARYPDSEMWTGRTFPDLELFKTASIHKEGSSTFIGLDGVERIFGYTEVENMPNSDIHVAVGLSKAIVSSAVTRISLQFILTLALYGLIVVAAVWVYGGRRLVWPLQRIALAASRIASGELGVRTGIEDDGTDVGRLAGSFDRMAAELETREGKLTIADEKLRRANRALKALSTGNRTILHSTSETAIYQQFCDIAVTVGGYTIAWVGMVDGDARRKPRMVAIGAVSDVSKQAFLEGWNRIPSAQELARVSYSTGKPYIVRDIAHDPNLNAWAAMARRFNFGSVICIPVFVGEAMTAVFVLHAREAESFSGDEVILLEEMAADLGYGVQTIRIREQNASANTALRESEQRYRTYMEQSIDGVFVMQDNGRFIEVNSAGCQMLGYTREELLQRNIRDFVTDGPEVERLGLDFLLNLIKSGHYTQDIRLKRKDGGVAYVDIRAVALGNNRNLGLFRDITERKTYENRLQEVNALSRTFLRIMSHQLRTPLNSVQWNLEALQSEQIGGLTSHQKDFVEVTLRANREVIDRVDDLLMVMDIEENRVVIHPRLVNMESLVESVFTDFDHACRMRRVACKRSVPRQGLPDVRGDIEKIRLVLSKLMQNAVQYTPKGGKIHMRVLKRGDRIRVEVSDTGVGIPKAEQKHIFTRFFRASNASQMQPDASGLGLYIAKRFIEANDGEIGFTSRQGKGSVFWIELPIAL